ncbi:MAG: hypothetical protein K2M17_06265, partial [Bacilli bacterium]|nr:hypothetical protein [Bacilli bacterium]
KKGMGKSMSGKVLLLAPDFYDYTRMIINGIRGLDFEVDFYDTRPQVSGFKKARMKSNAKSNYKILSRYKDEIVNRTKHEDYCLIIVIACVTFSREQLSEILSFHKDTKKVYYMWDSFCNYPENTEILSLFDKTYSFDPIDCKNYNMIYQPTFYSEHCIALRNELSGQEAVDKDIFFIASFLPKRYAILKKFIDYAKRKKIKFKYHLFVKSYLTYIYYKLKNFKLGLNRKHFSFTQMDERDKVKNILSSKCILDIPYNEQAGLTMRVLEGLVLGKKIITTNKFIKNYDFYSSGNIAVISDCDFSEVNQSFFDSVSTDNSFDFAEMFSIDSFIQNVFTANIK